MKSYFSVLLVFLFFSTLGHAQTKYKSHYVKEGETVSSITKQYQITPEELFRMNPEVKNGLKHNTVLVIPISETLSEHNDVTFKTHTVQRKETLFSLSQLYNVSQEEIKKHNKHLYSEQLKNGEEIRIPVKKITALATVVPGATVEKISDSPKGNHKVAAQETKYGVARKYGITVADLDALNPSLAQSDNLPLGFILKVPDVDSSQSAVQDNENFTYYEVKPAEGFYRLKVNFGWTEEEVIALNPFAKDGLKEGMILKMPKLKTTNTFTISTKAVKAVNLENKLTNFKPKNVVVFLPFQLNRVQTDSLAHMENQMINNATMRIALDFYSGVKIATEFAKQKGISVNLYVFDSQQAEAGTLSLFNRKNVRDVDVVIGPLQQAKVERVASELESQNIPVISPLSNRQSKMYSNFIQSIPSSELQENSMIAYIQENSIGKNIILVADASRSAQRQRLQEAIPGLVIVNPREGNYFRNQDISDKLQAGRENWVILETANATVASSAIRLLNGMARNNKIRLFTLDKNDAFDYSEISNRHLARLEFTYPAINSTTDVKVGNAFIDAYNERYGIMPNRYAARGFDITYDALLRLAYSKSLFDTNESIEGETKYFENKFHYQKNPQGGYYNTSVYILKYNSDLVLEVVK